MNLKLRLVSMVSDNADLQVLFPCLPVLGSHHLGEVTDGDLCTGLYLSAPRLVWWGTSCLLHDWPPDHPQFLQPLGLIPGELSVRWAGVVEPVAAIQSPTSNLSTPPANSEEQPVVSLGPRASQSKVVSSPDAIYSALLSRSCLQSTTQYLIHKQKHV